jgi:hypothetical protein
MIMWGRRRRVKPRRITIESMTAPLRANLPAAGDFGFEAIKALGDPVPMIVHNSGDSLLELWLEPFGQDYWLRPGEDATVTSYGRWDDHPFEVSHESDRITVWATSCFATVSDDSGKEILGAYQRPPGLYE